MGKLQTIAASLAFLVSTASQALVITATPLENESEAKTIYEPVAELLSEALGIEVVFEHSGDWLTFSKKIIASDYDMILSEPHITAYVTSKTSVLSMNALARLPGELKYHVIVAADSDSESLKDLQTARICMLPSPNFSGVMLMKEFTNPVSQPLVIEVRGSYDNVYQYFNKKRCDAAVIDDSSFQRLSTIDTNIKSIYETKTSPNVGLSVSERIPTADREIISNALKNPENAEKLQKLFSKYSDGKGPFDAAQNKDFQDFNILPGVVWGW